MNLSAKFAELESKVLSVTVLSPELLKIAPEQYDITVFGAEPYGNYNRIMLSPVLAGEKTIDDIMLNDEQWYIDNDITLYKGKTVTEIDRVNRRVAADDGTTADYDRLLLATGSSPFMIQNAVFTHKTTDVLFSNGKSPAKATTFIGP